MFLVSSWFQATTYEIGHIIIIGGRHHVGDLIPLLSIFSPYIMKLVFLALQYNLSRLLICRLISDVIQACDVTRM